ncbi:hypothetical protein BDV23DRAFT_167156 [Aspergillus alliaceus]|uniref:Uncharacterized protein n=1 Tax=Petromyces alliaceus TaxID=209559 RepID=A0A5N7BRJ7_PETAA|nr:hypothetical protein BDV23DRAFT_167156 [Aspergillus alliaceus]
MARLRRQHCSKTDTISLPVPDAFQLYLNECLEAVPSESLDTRYNEIYMNAVHNWVRSTPNFKHSYGRRADSLKQLYKKTLC